MSLFVRDVRLPHMDGERGDGGVAPWPAPLTNVRVEDERIVAVGGDAVALPGDLVFEAGGRVLMPGFVDAHTHALWAGDRLDEHERQRRGASYLDILAAGGGILSTVRAVRKLSTAELAARLVTRLGHMLREGTTTVEVKSGYGLSTEHELKMLRAIDAAGAQFPGTVVATALLGHALDPEEPRGVERVVSETLPAVHAEFPGITVDAFCESGAWSVADCRRLFERARALGHPLRLHADQVHRLGGVPLAIELGARSVDHLEASTPADLAALAQAGIAGVMLPATGFHTDGRYGDGRAFLDAGGALVLASNCNPGSAPTSSMPFVLALARRRLGVTMAEAIRASTSSAAALLGLADRGAIAPGRRADLLVLRHHDERLLGHELGGDPVDAVICAGRLVRAT